MDQDAIDDMQALYEDISASLFAFANALQKKGVLTKAELREAAQERLLKLTVGRQPLGPLLILRGFATELPDGSD